MKSRAPGLVPQHSSDESDEPNPDTTLTARGQHDPTTYPLPSAPSRTVDFWQEDAIEMTPPPPLRQRLRLGSLPWVATRVMSKGCKYLAVGH